MELEETLADSQTCLILESAGEIRYKKERTRTNIKGSNTTATIEGYGSSKDKTDRGQVTICGFSHTQLQETSVAKNNCGVYFTNRGNKELTSHKGLALSPT